MEKKYHRLYYLLSTLIAFFFAMSGYLEVTKNALTYVKTIEMGYPPYFIVALGCAKLCGSLILLVPKFTRLHSWVFAGFTFDVVFAFISGFMMSSYTDCIKSGIALVAILYTYSLFLKKQQIRSNGSSL